ncbi:GGL domain-containing protein [Mastacembelus armatus]|uniref:GGL domain-containing protein n=1 Tax=Mastacembelus armatus TaxID=205130 RepID=UPI000E456476|nr:guanine nucleotide-binding protein G(I)/G(S)/G(O) subunit gamma-7-like [Mastacembelus armatus]
MDGEEEARNGGRKCLKLLIQGGAEEAEDSDEQHWRVRGKSTGDRGKELKTFSQDCSLLKATSGKMSSSNSVVQAQKLVDQLRVEASMERIKISLTAADLVQYCQDHRRSDPLLTGIAASSNPFKDKKTCVLL